MSVLETIKKHAAAVNSGSNAAAIEYLQRAIDALKASEPKKESYAIIKKRAQDQKAARLDKFGAAIRSNKIDETDTLLSKFGWVVVHKNGEERTFGMEGNKGYRLQIKDGKFSMWKIAGPVMQEPTKIDQLGIYLHGDFKKHVK